MSDDPSFFSWDDSSCISNLDLFDCLGWQDSGKENAAPDALANQTSYSTNLAPSQLLQVAPGDEAKVAQDTLLKDTIVVKCEEHEHLAKAIDPAWGPTPVSTVVVHPQPQWPIPAKIGELDGYDVYEPLPAWGRDNKFHYDKLGQLEQDVTFDAESIREYLYEHPLGSQLIIWIQRHPSKAHLIYNTAYGATCHYRIAIDELTGRHPNHKADTYIHAAMFHVACFEKLVDICHVARNFNFQPENRQLVNDRHGGGSSPAQLRNRMLLEERRVPQATEAWLIKVRGDLTWKPTDVGHTLNYTMFSKKWELRPHRKKDPNVPGMEGVAVPPALIAARPVKANPIWGGKRVKGMTVKQLQELEAREAEIKIIAHSFKAPKEKRRRTGNQDGKHIPSKKRKKILEIDRSETVQEKVIISSDPLCKTPSTTAPSPLVVSQSELGWRTGHSNPRKRSAGTRKSSRLRAASSNPATQVPLYQQLQHQAPIAPSSSIATTENSQYYFGANGNWNGVFEIRTPVHQTFSQSVPIIFQGYNQFDQQDCQTNVCQDFMEPVYYHIPSDEIAPMSSMTMEPSNFRPDVASMNCPLNQIPESYALNFSYDPSAIDLVDYNHQNIDNSFQPDNIDPRIFEFSAPGPQLPMQGAIEGSSGNSQPSSPPAPNSSHSVLPSQDIDVSALECDGTWGSILLGSDMFESPKANGDALLPPQPLPSPQAEAELPKNQTQEIVEKAVSSPFLKWDESDLEDEEGTRTEDLFLSDM
ncbi:hypothetical protein BDZ91DRAFT_782050 [Kalaharituber pfeilii]|nr:hypothetical protein BDZ91DRAFT_782050 [Kalaharituber pfeilii]